jgi:hypothetical protein
VGVDVVLGVQEVLRFLYRDVHCNPSTTRGETKSVVRDSGVNQPVLDGGNGLV